MTATCFLCRAPLSGRVWRFEDGSACCARCRAAHPACAGCGKPLTGPASSCDDGRLCCAACAARLPRCSICERSLVGAHRRWDDGTRSCGPCQARLPACDGCGQPFQRGRREGAHHVCEHCAHTAARCVVCAGLALGRVFRYDGAGIVCAECQERAPRCARCGVPARVLIAPDGNPQSAIPPAGLCRACFDAAPRCHCCGIALAGRYLTFAGRPDRAFCPACVERREACDFCGQPLGKKWHGYPDGRLACAECRASAVTAPAELERLHAQARRFLERQCGLPLRAPAECPVRLVGAVAGDGRSAAGTSRQAPGFRLQASNHAGAVWTPKPEARSLQPPCPLPPVPRPPPADPGFHRRERGRFLARAEVVTDRGEEVERREELAILIEEGLPRAEAYGVLVHELTHLWQHDQFPRAGVDPRWVEGLACWMQLQALLAKGDEAGAERLRHNPDPIYGDGLRAVSALAAEVGAARVPATLALRLAQGRDCGLQSAE